MPRRPLLALALAACTAGLLTVAPLPASAGGQGPFAPVSTFRVGGDVAEILAATPDGRTVLYTDSSQQRIGLVDLSRPAAPRQFATIDLGGEPTSVAVTPRGTLALVAVDTTDGAFPTPSGHLAVVDLVQRRVRSRIDLGGQPDSVSISPDGEVAAIAVENQRDEELVVDGVEGGLPQGPPGHLAVVDLTGPVARWQADRVALTGLPGARYARDPEPEFVDVDDRHRAAVTLQENNAVAVVDLDALRVTSSFSAGKTYRSNLDLQDDGVVSFTERLIAPREPDAVRWTPAGDLVTADEGDLAPTPSGGRGWTIFSETGDVVHRERRAEVALARAGRYPDDRSDSKGAELEGAEVAAYGGRDLVLIGSERGDAVLVYALRDGRSPRLLQVLATGDEPEGILALPGRGLLVTGNEGDGTLSVFRYAGTDSDS